MNHKSMASNQLMIWLIYDNNDQLEKFFLKTYYPCPEDRAKNLQRKYFAVNSVDSISPLFPAICLGKEEALSIMLRNPLMNIAQRRHRSMTPLMCAVQHQHCSIIQRLLYHPFCTRDVVNMVNEEGNHALMMACQEEETLASIAVVKTLVEHMSFWDWECKNNQGKTIQDMIQNKNEFKKWIEEKQKKIRVANIFL